MIDSLREIFNNRTPKQQASKKSFSVLVPFLNIDDEFNILFEVRSKDLDKQPGEICFPGGKREDNESIEETALRETFEEIGLSDINIIGRTDDESTLYGSNIHTFVGVDNHFNCEKLKLNSDEVEDVFLVPFNWFLDNEPIDISFGKIRDERSKFPYDKIKVENYSFASSDFITSIYAYGEYVIWGLTSRIIKNIVEEYKFKLGENYEKKNI